MPVDFGIVDAHVHQWDPFTTPRGSTPLAKLLRPWPDLYRRVCGKLAPKSLREFAGGTDHLVMPFLPSDLAAGFGGLKVDAVVHVEAGWMDLRPLGPAGETRWLEGLPFQAAGTRLGAIVAHADLRSPRVGELLSAHAAASPKFVGIRHMASHHPDRGVFAWSRRPRLYVDAKFLRGFETLATRGLRFDAWVYSTQLADVTALADRFPQVPIVLDHLGTPVGAAGPVAGVGATGGERERIVGAWREGLAALSERKNVSAKISGLTMPVIGFGYHARTSPPGLDELTSGIGPFVRHALDVFGTERCFFASNFPMDKVSAPYERHFEAFAQLAAERGPHAARALLRDNAMRFYAIPRTSGGDVAVERAS
ncbi:MAG TPA: amidohydrolase family protein [Polyangiaceae bacterium]|nr:amidohydrolase family protein [Polyangiaceae bacterium]